MTHLLSLLIPLASSMTSQGSILEAKWFKEEKLYCLVPDRRILILDAYPKSLKYFDGCFKDGIIRAQNTLHHWKVGRLGAPEKQFNSPRSCARSASRSITQNDTNLYSATTNVPAMTTIAPCTTLVTACFSSPPSPIACSPSSANKQIAPKAPHIEKAAKITILKKKATKPVQTEPSKTSGRTSKHKNTYFEACVYY